MEKAFDFAGMGARNGVMAATMVAMGFSAVEDPFSGYDSIYETWNAVDGFPWNLGDYGAQIKYKRLIEGYETLPRTIEERFKKGG